jgi:glucose/arabinose dehydrogenase
VGPRILFLVVLALVLAPPAQAHHLVPAVPGFQDQVVLDGLESPMAVRFAPAPDGRIFVAQKDGRVVAYSGPGDDNPRQILDLRTEVHDYWDRGLLGMALDPNWATEPYLYLLYARDAEIGGDPPRWNDACDLDVGCPASARLVRVRVDDFDVGPVVPLIEDEWCSQFQTHTIGTVAFGPDGMLYVGAGDSASAAEVDYGQLPEDDPNPCGDPENEGGMLRSQDLRTSGPSDPTGLNGTILRLDPDTGAPAPGNPLTGPDENASRIVAYGLRNPFRFTFKPDSSELWIGDVGWMDWEEIDKIDDPADAVVENFGWPCYEGTIKQWAVDPYDLPLCEGLQQSETTKPVFKYEHAQASFAGGCDLRSGASVSGIAFSPAAYPEQYDDALFFADFAGGCLFALRPDEHGELQPQLMARRDEGTAGPVDLQEGPGGDLYYTSYDAYNPAEGSLHRLAYRSGRPTAAISATPTDGELPLDVHFSAAGSTDPDGEALTYAWDLDGDGDYDDATGLTAQRTYDVAGKVMAGVKVTNEHAATDSAAVAVWPGDTAPRPRILAPDPATTWKAGDHIEFRGEAADDEDPELGASSLDWIITLEHCIGTTETCHTHPLERHSGVEGGTFSAPDHPYPTRLVVKLVATDSAGLSASTTVKLDQVPPPHTPTDPVPTPQGEVKGGTASGGGGAAAGGALTLTLSAPARRALARRVSLLARCSHRCVLTPAARLVVRGRSRSLRAARRRTGRIVVTLPAAARSRARAALRRHRSARVRVVVTARDAAGATARRRATIRLVRGA